MRVLIAGGGIGGLTAALALLKHGIDVDVYEQAAELKEVGAGVQLAANGTRVLYALGIGEELKALSCEAQGKEIRHWQSGETWKLFDLGPLSIERYGAPYFTVYRPDLLEVLARALRRAKPDALHLGAKVRGLAQDGDSVALQLENGTTMRGDALVCADGVHSRIRQALYGTDRAEFTGVIAWRGIAPMARLPARMARMVGSNWIGPGGHVVHYPLRGGQQYNLVVTFHSRRQEQWGVTDGSKEEVLSYFDGIHPLPHQMLDRPTSWKRWATADREPVERWSVGRVTLLGDAAHPMTQYLAQGACQALEDAVTLGAAMEVTDGDFEAAFALYEQARIARTARVLYSTREMGRIYHAKGVERLVRNSLWVGRTQEQFYDAIQWLHGWRAEGCLKGAV